MTHFVWRMCAPLIKSSVHPTRQRTSIVRHTNTCSSDKYFSYTEYMYIFIYKQLPFWRLYLSWTHSSFKWKHALIVNACVHISAHSLCPILTYVIPRCSPRNQHYVVSRGEFHALYALKWRTGSPTYTRLSIVFRRCLQLYAWGCDSCFKYAARTHTYIVHKVCVIRESGPRISTDQPIRRNACHWGATYFTPY